MKRIALSLMVVTIAITVTSCIGCGKRESITQRMSTIVQEAAKIAEEEKEDATFAERVFRVTGDDLYKGDRYMSVEEWNKTEAMVKDLTALLSEGAGSLNREAAAEIIAKHGYESFEEGQEAIRKIAELNQKKISIMMSIQSIQVSRTLGSREEAEKEAESLKKNITEEWKFTREDIKALDEKTEVIGSSLATIMVISALR